MCEKVTMSFECGLGTTLLFGGERYSIVEVQQRGTEPDDLRITVRKESKALVTFAESMLFAEEIRRRREESDD